MTQKNMGRALLGESDGRKPTARHRGTKGGRRLATLPSWQRPCVTACENGLVDEGSLAATTHCQQSHLGAGATNPWHSDQMQQRLAAERVGAADAQGMATSIGPPPGLECPGKGIGEARADLEAAIRKLLAPPASKSEPCPSPLQELPLSTGGLDAEASVPIGTAAVPMLNPANVTDNRPDDTIAELLRLRSRLADRLSRPSRHTAIPSAVQMLMACSAAPAWDEPWHVY